MVMARNVAIVVEGPDGTELAVHRANMAARLKVDEGDGSSGASGLPNGIPYEADF